MTLAASGPAPASHHTVDGDMDALRSFFGLLDTFPFWFNIVTP